MSLASFVEGADTTGVALAVVNRESPRPLQRLLETMFDKQPVAVEEWDVNEEVRDVVYLVTDGDVVASSPLAELQRSVLTVNSDIYVTGSRGVEEVDVPDVIEGLTEIPFQLRGYPESNKEKLLLITISRYIEQLALENGGGKHRASFQRLSRLNDEQGTRAAYERLAESEVDTHLYGMPDWTPPPEFDVTIHGGWDQEFRESWFVVHVPDEESSRHAGLVALESEHALWHGFWTYDPATVQEINRYIEREL